MIFKLELAILFFFVCVSLTGQSRTTPGTIRAALARDLATSDSWRRLLIRSVVVIGACEALVALVLFAAPRELALRVLLRLGPLGYPTDSTVLRYLPDTDRLRAIGTAIDPNVLGALLMIVGIITLTQLLAAEPVLPRRWLVVAAVVVLPALLVTFSRSSWLGLAAGVRVDGAGSLPAPAAADGSGGGGVRALAHHATVRSAPAVRSPRAGPRRGDAVGRAGERLADHPSVSLAGYRVRRGTMTLQSCTTPGAIRAALECHTMTLYPGVSNVFLTIAEQAGLIGMAAYVAALAVALGAATILWWRHRAAPGADLLLSLLAALAVCSLRVCWITTSPACRIS